MNNILTFEKFTYNQFANPIYTLTENTTYFDFSGNRSVYESSDSGSMEDRIDSAIDILKMGLAYIPCPPASKAVSITHGMTYLIRGIVDNGSEKKIGYFALGFMELLMSFFPLHLVQKIKTLGKIKDKLVTIITKLPKSGKLKVDNLLGIVKSSVECLVGIFSQFIAEIVKNIPSPDDIKNKIYEVLGMETIKTVLGDLIDYIKDKISSILDIYGNFYKFMKQISTSGS